MIKRYVIILSLFFLFNPLDLLCQQHVAYYSGSSGGHSLPFRSGSSTSSASGGSGFFGSSSNHPFMFGAGLVNSSREIPELGHHWGVHLSANYFASDKLSVQSNLLLHIPEVDSTPEVDEIHGFYSLNLTGSMMLLGNTNNGLGLAFPEVGIDYSLYHYNITYASDISNVEDVSGSEFSIGYNIGASIYYSSYASKVYLKSIVRHPMGSEEEYSLSYISFILGYMFRL